MVRRWLFRLGNEYASITGGFGRYAWSYNTATESGAAPDGSNDGTRLTVSLSNLYNTGWSGVIRTENMIDLTNVGSIRVHISGTFGACDTANGGFQAICLFTRQSTSGNWESGDTALALVASHTSGGAVNFEGDYTLNVAALTGLHYVCIGIRWKKQNGASTFYITEVERKS